MALAYSKYFDFLSYEIAQFFAALIYFFSTLSGFLILVLGVVAVVYFSFFARDYAANE